MSCSPTSPFLQRLRGRVTLREIPFSERGSRLLVFRHDAHLSIRLAERWAKWESEVGDYRHRAPIVDDFVFTDENGTPLNFELAAYPHALCLETHAGYFVLTFIDEEMINFGGSHSNTFQETNIVDIMQLLNLAAYARLCTSKSSSSLSPQHNNQPTIGLQEHVSRQFCLRIWRCIV